LPERCHLKARGTYIARIAVTIGPGPRLNSIIYINPNAKRKPPHSTRSVLKRDRGARCRHSRPAQGHIDVANMPTTNGSAIMKDAVPPEDGSITKALLAAGAVILGRLRWAIRRRQLQLGTRSDAHPISQAKLRRSSSGSGAAISCNFGVLAVGRIPVHQSWSRFLTRASSACARQPGSYRARDCAEI